MKKMTKRATVYLEHFPHHGLQIKGGHTRRSMSEIGNDAVRVALREDREDLTVFDEGAQEPSISYEDLLQDLRKHGKI